MSETSKQIVGSRKARASAARLAAVQAIYQMQKSGQSAGEIVDEYIMYRLGEDVDGEAMVTPDGVLFRATVQGVYRRKAEIREIVYKHLNHKDDRAVEDLLEAILFCGTFEIMDRLDTDAPIIISDYVTVTRAFYEQGEPALVNAVLDKISSNIRG